MSLEQSILDLTAKLDALIEVTVSLRDLRAEAIERTTAVAATKPTKPAKDTAANETPKTDDKPVTTAAGVYEGLKEIVADYVGGSEREEERAARKGKIKSLLNHEKIKKADIADASRIDHIREDSVALFKSQVAKLKEKGDLTEAPKTKAADDLDL